MATSTPTPSSAGLDQSFPPAFKIVGIVLAIVSGLLIGSSFVFKKKGLLRSQGDDLGEGVAYLKSPMWWTGMSMMILGEFCNFAAYAFVPAVVVTPLGALSVVICAILSSIFLKETLTFFGWLGCALCIVGSIVIALNAPHQATVGRIKEFQKLFLAPGFLVFAGSLIAASLVIIVYFIPLYGKKSMLWYIMVCSMFGGLSVSTTTGLGAAIVMSIFMHESQFKNVFIYILIVFVTITLLTEVFYLNKALALFNTAMVTPTYYVIFTGLTLITSVVLYQGLQASAIQILTIVMGFLVICAGITILQMSKVDPTQLGKLDRRSTILLQASRKTTEHAEKSASGVEDPGMDALRGSFGTVGSIIRARSARRMSRSSRMSRDGTHLREGLPVVGGGSELPRVPGEVQRHQLYDAPVPSRKQSSSASDVSGNSRERPSLQSTPRMPTIKFGDQDVAHYYHGPGEPADARHERVVPHGSQLGSPGSGSRLQRQPSPLAFDLDESTSTIQKVAEPRVSDPYQSSPVSAAGAPFPPVTYEDEPPRGTPPRRYPSSGVRSYPKRGDQDDREESISLVRGPLESDSPLEGESESEVDAVPQQGIRLLPSSK